MFTKLRNRFLILNMSITSLVIVTAFAIIYFITYNNVTMDIQNHLNARSELQVVEGDDLPDHREDNGNAPSTSKKMVSNDMLSFTIEVDANGNILTVDSLLDLPDEVYKRAAETAWSHKESHSTITLDGRQWRYRVNPVNVNVIQKSGQQLTLDERRFTLVFLDVTTYRRTLLDLLTTLLFVGIVTLFVIFVVSLFFANRSIKPLAEAWSKQKQFVADASHELKTPLSIVNANYDVLLANQDETIKSQIKWLGYMRIGMDRLTKLIDDLLTLAKIEDVRLETQKQSFNISTAIQETIWSMEAAVNEKGIKLNCSIDPDIVVKSDAEKVKQVIAIMLDNAIKYTDDNGQIEISLLRSKRQITFSIKNSGKGIAKQDLPKVFDRFFRAESSRTHKSGSYGLGLSIAKTIMDRLGGEINVTSVENEWTTFTIQLKL